MQLHCGKSRSGLLLIVKALLWIALFLATAAGASWLGMRYAGSGAALQLWLDELRPWLQVWRLGLYAVIAGMWFHRVRRWLIKQTRNLAVVRRVEWLTLGLMTLIELNAHHRALF